MTSVRIPPRSPYGLIQEDLWDGTSVGEWRILLACMFLNCTSRKQVERVLPQFIRRWPDPTTLLRASRDDVVNVCRPLGFANRRTDNIFKMTAAFQAGDWHHAHQLPGVGDYGARAWEIFCLGRLGDDPPNDHALVRYHRWAREKLNEQRKEDT